MFSCMIKLHVYVVNFESLRKMYAAEFVAASLALLSFFQISRAQENFYDWKHQRVALPNSSIHLRYAGSGPPLLLIHGVPEHSVS